MDATSLNSVVLVHVTLEAVVNLLFQHGRAGVAEYTQGDLTAVVVPTLGIDEDFDVARFAISRNNSGHFEIRGRFARGFNGNSRDGTDGKAVFNHGGDRYMRSQCPVQPGRKRIYRDVTIAKARRRYLVT